MTVVTTAARSVAQTHVQVNLPVLSVDYTSGVRNKKSVLARFVLALPILALAWISGALLFPVGAFLAGYQYGLATSVLFVAPAIMIAAHQKYPRWWFDFNVELTKFSYRTIAYVALLTDKYPSTEDDKSVRVWIRYPDVKKDLNRWLPLVKWIAATPHYLALAGLLSGIVLAVAIGWVSILATGKFPKFLHEYIVGVLRYHLRVMAYAILLTSDSYPPFSIEQ
ncbi:MAG: DUF4389 domain-containing protein [Chloroflexi bacterium]|nr:DUF4389 domain-containing protein [Chloroflexota bacterium]